MIRGVGVDLVEVARVRGALERWGERFLARVFTAGEVADARRGGDFAGSLAGRFAAKEAAYKALRERLGCAVPLRALVVSAGRGRAPRVTLDGSAAGRGPGGLAAAGAPRLWCSISHTRGVACAVVVAEDEDARGGPG